MTALNHQTQSRLVITNFTIETSDLVLHVSRPRVDSLMKQMGIRRLVNKECKLATTDFDHKNVISKNLLNRVFFDMQTSQKWISDIIMSEPVRGGSI